MARKLGRAVTNRRNLFSGNTHRARASDRHELGTRQQALESLRHSRADEFQHELVLGLRGLGRVAIARVGRIAKESRLG